MDLTGFNIFTGKQVLNVSLLNKKLVGGNAVAVALEHLDESDTLVVLFRTGELVSVALGRSADECPAECVGCIDSGAIGMGWSPDGEMVVIATGNATLFIMSKEWSPISEVPIRHATDGVPLRFDISWESDGGRFVTNTQFEDQTRSASFWSRQGGLLSTFETTAPIGSPVAFRPTGFLAAAASSNKGEVFFFESNGLRHGGFSLRRGEGESALALRWNPDASLLAVVCDDQVQIWRSANYVWHLAWEERAGAGAKLIGWSQLHAARLVWKSPAHGAIRCVDFAHQVFCSSQHGAHDSDEALTVVVDGQSLRLTPFKTKAIPPPMSDTVVEVPFVASHVCTTYDSRTAKTAALAPDGRLMIFSPGSVVYFREPDYKLRLPSACWVQVAWMNVTTLLLLSSEGHLVALDASSGKCLGDHLMVVGAAAVQEHGQRIHCNQVTGRCVLIHGSGRLSRILLNERSGQLGPLELLRESLPESGSFWWTESNASHLFALSARWKLYALPWGGGGGPVLLLDSECTSFALHNRFLVFTTLKSKLRFVPLVSCDGPLSVSASLDREVDSGAQLICCIARGTRTVLQAPRGNLEVVYPRALVLSAVESLVEQRKFARALELMRKHKVDLSGLVDEATLGAFVESAPEFVAQNATDPDRLCLFLTQLGEGKRTTAVINRVCTVLREVMQGAHAHESNHFLLPILTSFVQQKPPQLEGALGIISSLRGGGGGGVAGAELYNVSRPRAHKEVAERALDYLCFLVNPDQLYDAALGMYDFELVTVVAKKCQKDPNEYVPFLEALKKLPAPRMRYKIDVHLQRWESAIANLAAERSQDAREECIRVIKERRLFRFALNRVFLGGSNHGDDNNEARRQVWHAYGEYLFSKNHTVEAAICYQRAQSADAELQCYYALGDWAWALLRFPNVVSQEQMAQTLEQQKRWEELARFLSHIAGGGGGGGAKDTAVIASALLNGGFWAEAQLWGLTNWDTRLHSLGVEQLSSLKGTRTRFEQLLARLRVLRQERVSWDAMPAGVDPATLETPSEYSEASVASTASRLSSASSASSVATLAAGRARQRTANQKKVGKTSKGKRLTGKPGSMHEEEWLVRELRSLIPSEELLRNVHKLLVFLMRAQMDAAAQAIQAELTTLCRIVDEATPTLIAPALVFGVHGQRHWEHWRPNGAPAYLVVEERPDAPVGTDVISADPSSLVSREFVWPLVLLEERGE